MQLEADSENGNCGRPAPSAELPSALSAIRRDLSLSQWVLVVLVAAGAVWGSRFTASQVFEILAATTGFAFLFVVGWRCLLILAGRTGTAEVRWPDLWPRYTILAALHDEAEVVDQLIGRLAAIDYPTDRLQGYLVLEAHDLATRAAADAASRPDWLQIFIAPPGAPGTKPRALNCALPHATGHLLTVYDAEDDPDPGQLKEAASRFLADSGGRLACLQAPLRIRPASGSRTPFFDRQFAAEYASLFEITLPGLTGLGLPFPLGGTSNHFRVDVLRAIGGWDSCNVTEDADLGFRLWRQGWRIGVIKRPTWETPPGALHDWLPQRTRWLKGYMQTWGVHTRRLSALGPRGLFALIMTLGVGLTSAALYGPALCWVLASVLVAAMAGLPPETPRLALSVLVLGAAAAWLSCALGARRAGVPYGAGDMLAAPLYWSLLSLAFTQALWRLVIEPFAWDKTRHRREVPVIPGDVTLDEPGSHRLSATHAATPEPVA